MLMFSNETLGLGLIWDWFGFSCVFGFFCALSKEKLGLGLVWGWFVLGWFGSVWVGIAFKRLLTGLKLV